MGWREYIELTELTKNKVNDFFGFENHGIRVYNPDSRTISASYNTTTGECLDGRPRLPENKPFPKLKKGVKMSTLFNIFLVYGENRLDPVVKQEHIIAEDREEAKLKTSLRPTKTWDIDFVTLIVSEIGDCTVKERPTEVLNVTK